jgi:hypothetical protein
MRAAAAVLAALGCVAVVVAEDAPASEPAPRLSTAERLRLEFAPSQPEPAPAPLAAGTDSTPIVRLPRLDVRDRPIPLRDDELLTPKGRLAAAKRATLSPMYQHTFGPLSWAALLYFNPLALLSGVKPNDAEAMALYEQDEAIRRNYEIRELQDLATLAEQAAAVRPRADESDFRAARKGTRGGD